MAYVPPHKRPSKESVSPSPVPASLSQQFKKGLSFRSPENNAHQSGKIANANTTIYRWLTVGLDFDGDHLPCGVFLKPVSVEAIAPISGEKLLSLLALGKSRMVNEEDETGQDHWKKPWEHIAETVMQDLVSSFEVVRSEIKGPSFVRIKPMLVARFGKNLFRGTPPFPVEACGDIVTENSLKQRKKLFYTNLPSSFVEDVTQRIITEIGLSFEDEKDRYIVLLSDKSRPDVTITCKCNVIKADQRLELYKVELNPVRRLVVDVSCLNKDLDMRLMLFNKRILTAIDENAKNSISDLITSAVLDSNVKGGLRWPLGKASSGDRYSVVGMWHTISKRYKNSSMKLEARHADRFEFGNSHGEVTEEVELYLKGIISELHGQSVGTDSISDMLKDAVKMMWEHFLSCGYPVV
ncbi:uncharacterized protein LOC115734257 [Rhodamnia argentea]|uniref:Uncharacterized protein LOC115734257 n=1 Tax=Rhodamnia argentea TaxID=178133 RepID=A0A8B8NFK3_9MYRT|nr:uncharacterized protein LOC115734257 [Rhodamnia argentea]